MADNYNATQGDVTSGINSSSLPDEVKQAILKDIAKVGSSVTVSTVDTPLTGGDIQQGDNIVYATQGGTVDLSGLDKQVLKGLKVLAFDTTDDVDLTIDNKKFDGTVSLGSGDDTLRITSNKGVAVNTGAGDDSVTTGGGKDSVVVGSGNDSVNVGKGNDIIKVSGDFSNNVITIDGGAGTDKLDLLGLDVVDVQRGAGKNSVEITLNDGTVIDVSNVEKFAYDVNGDGEIGKGETLNLVKLVGLFSA
jgi:hypothetical protein